MPRDDDTAAPFVRLRRLRKSYGGGVTALDDVSLDISRGEFVTLLGPSGSGKTTLLRLLAGDDRPDGGAIEIDGKSMAGVSRHRRRVGALLDDDALSGGRTVLETVAAPLAAQGLKRRDREARARRLLSLLELDGDHARVAARLPGGQRSLVALARALVTGPPLVLLDDMLGRVDAVRRLSIGRRLRRLQRHAGITVLQVGGDVTQAMTLSDRLAVLDRGRLAQIGTPAEIYDAPETLLVAAAGGEINQFHGLVLGPDEDDERVWRVRLRSGAVVDAVATDAMLRAGSRCVVAVRPERMAIAVAAADDLGPHALSARLAEAVYVGDHVRLRVWLADGTAVTVKRIAAAPLAGFAPGARLALAWRQHDARVFHAP